MKAILILIFILIFTPLDFGQESNNNNVAATNRGKAIDFYTREDCKSAFPLFAKLIEADKNDWNSWLYAAMCLQKTGDQKNAEMAFKQAMVVYPFKEFHNNNRPDQNTDFKITTLPDAPLIDTSRASNISGFVFLAVEFRADKKIGLIIPVKTLPGGITERSIDAAKGIKFNPQTLGGKPISIIRIMEYYFQIK